MKKTAQLGSLSMSFLLICSLTNCSQEKNDNSEQSETSTQEITTTDSEILLNDSMLSDWQENWFLDGEKATLEHRPEGLYFAGGTVTKEQDPEEYHAHHALLWTKQEFEGDIRISYNWTQVDTSDYGAVLLYVQAQGIGVEPYAEDISKWSELRKISAMEKYFTNMNLISLSIRENVRCKRYPWFDREGNMFQAGGLIDPMVEYDGEVITGRTYQIVVEKRNPMVSMTMTDTVTGKAIINHTWDTSKVDERVEPKLVTKGRIGLRQMSTKQTIYKDFKVERL